MTWPPTACSSIWWRGRYGPAVCWRCSPTRCAAGEHSYLAARRFSAVAVWCFVAMALSGVVNALVRVRPAELLNTGYGWLILAKAAALCMLGVIGWLSTAPRHRRPAGRSGGERTPDQAGARRGGDLRPDVRHRGGLGQDTAATATGLQSRRSPRSRSATTSRGRRLWPACCSTGASTSSSARRQSYSRSFTFSP